MLGVGLGGEMVVLPLLVMTLMLGDTVGGVEVGSTTGRLDVLALHCHGRLVVDDGAGHIS